MSPEILIPQDERKKTLERLERRTLKEVNAGRIIHFNGNKGLGWVNYITEEGGVLATETYMVEGAAIVTKLHCSEEQAKTLEKERIIRL